MQPTLETRRSYNAVERHCQLETLLLGIEAIHIKNAQPANWRILNRIDQRLKIQILVFLPEMFEDCGKQNRFTAADRVYVDTH